MSLEEALARIPVRKPPPRPGKVLVEDWLRPFDISQNLLARMMGVNPRDVNCICSGRRPITPRMAILLGRVLYTGAHYWLHLQADYDIARLEARVLVTLPDSSAIRAPPDIAEDCVEIDY